MKCNTCKYFSLEKVRMGFGKDLDSNKSPYLYFEICNYLNIIIDVKRDIAGLDYEEHDIFPVWECPKLQELRKQDKMPHVMFSIVNRYTANDFDEWIKNN